MDDAQDPEQTWKETGLPVVGYFVFVVGALLIALLARNHDPEFYELAPPHQDNLFVELLVYWLVAGLTHALVRDYPRACKISTLGSVLGCTVLIFLWHEANEMLMVGMVMAGAFGYVVSLAMGLPVMLYRQARDDRHKQGGIERP